MRVRKSICMLFAMGLLALPTMGLKAAEPQKTYESVKEPQQVMEQETKEALFADAMDVQDTLDINTTNDVLDISGMLQARASGVLGNNPASVVSGQLSEEDQSDLVFFSVTQDTFLTAMLLSDNTDYYAQLYIVDFTTNTATPTVIKKGAGESIIYNGLPMGDYAILIATENTMDSVYNFHINASNKAGNISDIVYISSTSLKQLVLKYSNGDIYANGSFIFNENAMEELDLTWSRQFNLNYPGGGYHNRYHGISKVKIKSIDYRPIKYSSTYVSSDYAIMIYLDEGTLFTYRNSVYNNGGPLNITFVDTTGNKTPRRLVGEDFTKESPVLIYDISTQKVIDFCSFLNYYYASGVESASYDYLD